MSSSLTRFLCWDFVYFVLLWQRQRLCCISWWQGASVRVVYRPCEILSQSDRGSLTSPQHVWWTPTTGSHTGVWHQPVKRENPDFGDKRGRGLYYIHGIIHLLSLFEIPGERDKLLFCTLLSGLWVKKEAHSPNISMLTQPSSAPSHSLIPGCYTMRDWLQHEDLANPLLRTSVILLKILCIHFRLNTVRTKRSKGLASENDLLVFKGEKKRAVYYIS